jgi:enterochelin esterase-like enzyme
MGGLISMYALCEYPEVFGGAACLSTHWPGIFTLDKNPIPEAFINYLNNNLPPPEQHKLYFDCGDQTLDAMYPSIQKRVDRVLSQKGFTSSSSMSRYFKDEAHDEKAWTKRLHVPLEFLFNSKNNP